MNYNLTREEFLSVADKHVSVSLAFQFPVCGYCYGNMLPTDVQQMQFVKLIMKPR